MPWYFPPTLALRNSWLHSLDNHSTLCVFNHDLDLKLITSCAGNFHGSCALSEFSELQFKNLLSLLLGEKVDIFEDSQTAPKHYPFSNTPSVQTRKLMLIITIRGLLLNRGLNNPVSVSRVTFSEASLKSSPFVLLLIFSFVRSNFIFDQWPAIFRTYSLNQAYGHLTAQMNNTALNDAERHFKKMVARWVTYLKS